MPAVMCEHQVFQYAVLDLLTPKVTQKRKRWHLVERFGKVTTEQLRLRLAVEREKLMSEYLCINKVVIHVVTVYINEICIQTALSV